MRYRELDVPPALRPFVRAVWHLKGEADGGASEPIVPDGCLELVLNLGAPVDEHDGGGQVRRQPAAMVAGVIDAPTMITPTGDIDIWGVRLQPWAAHAVLGASAPEVRRATMPLDDVARGVARLLADVGELTGDEARGRRLMQVLAAHAAHSRVPPATTMALTARALDATTPRSVRELAREAGVGTRRVQAMFSEEVGAGPKLLMRVGRFQRALALARGTDASWGTIAARAGYFDHAHLIRDSRQFAGCAPTALFPDRPSLTELFVGGQGVARG